MQLEYFMLLVGFCIGSFMGFGFAQALEEYRHWRVLVHFREMAEQIEKRNKRLKKKRR